MTRNRFCGVVLGAVLLAALGSAGAQALDPTIPSAQPIDKTANVLGLANIEKVMTGPIDVELLAAEDAKREAEGLPPRFAVPNPVVMTPDSHGVWETTDDGIAVWRLRVSCPEALSINLGFTRFFMPAGGRLLLYSADEEYIVRPFTAEDNDAHGQLWTPTVPGDEMVIEVTLPESEKDALQLELGSINHGYRRFGYVRDDYKETEQLEKSGSCNVDVRCSQGDDWRDEIRSVAAYSRGGSIICTGFLVNNTSQDRTPYFMTADHCGVTTTTAASLVVYWRYENSTCRTPGSSASGGNGDGWLGLFQTGAIHRADYTPSDFTLVELDDDPHAAFNVYYLGWNRSTGNPSESVCIHHPSGDEKRISFEDDATTTTSYLGTSSPGDGTHMRVADWDLGTVEPGSSGSPLLDPNHRVVGQLHGGYSACGNDLAVWYGRFSKSWTGDGTSAHRLSNWLDPGSTGVTTLNGLNGVCNGNTSQSVYGFGPCMGESMSCQVLRHECISQTGQIVFSGGGISGSWTHLGWRCGSSSTYNQYIEVYVNDEAHTWDWPDYCVHVGSPFTLVSGNLYSFRGPSVTGATAVPFTMSTYTPPLLSVYLTRSNNNQTITAHASGGTPGYSYAWYRKPVCSGGGGIIEPDKSADAPTQAPPEAADGTKPGSGAEKDLPCTSWWGPYTSSPANVWTPYQGYNQNVKVKVTDSAGAVAWGYSYVGLD